VRELFSFNSESTCAVPFFCCAIARDAPSRMKPIMISGIYEQMDFIRMVFEAGDLLIYNTIFTCERCNKFTITVFNISPDH